VIAAVVCFPYKGESKNKWTIGGQISQKLDWGAGAGFTHPAEVALSATLAKVDIGEWPVGRPFVVGELWVRTADTPQPPWAEARGITTPVTFKIHADKTPPDDAPGYVSGTAHLTQTGALTTPSPPPFFGWPSPLTIAAEGGTPVALAKGWKYKVDSVQAGEYQPPATFPEISVPPDTEYVINVTLEMQMGTTILSVRDGQPTAAHVEVLDANNGLVASEDTRLDPQGNYSLVLGMTPPGAYTAKARPLGGGDYGTATPFNAGKTWKPEPVTVTVPPDPQPPPP
jgi:hypothetical protein